VVVWRGLGALRGAYAACEAAFGLTLIGMGLTLHLVPWSLVAGRLLEGVAAGMSLPLLFELVARGGGADQTPRRLAVFNSLFAIGFVAGPPLVEGLLRLTSAAAVLAGAGALCVALAGACLPLLPSPPPAGGAPPARGGWLATFLLLFLAKTSYGFVLPFTTDALAPRMAPLSLGQVMLFLSLAVVAGQALAVPLDRRVRAIVYPTLLAGLMVVLFVTGVPWLLFPAGLVHSLLLHAGLVGAAAQPGGARDFALVSSLSDPGMVLGSALALTGEPGLLLVAALCLTPLLRARIAA
jgi:hypothetical protein